MKFLKSKKFLYTGLIVLVLILSILGGLVVGHMQKNDNKVPDFKSSEREQTSIESKDKKETEEYSEIQKDTNKENDNGTVSTEEYLKQKSDTLNLLEKEKTNSNLSKINNANYSKEYQEYLNLPEDEKEKIEVIPREREVNYDELYNIIEKENKLIEEEPNKLINDKNTENNEETSKVKEENNKEPKENIEDKNSDTSEENIDDEESEELPKRFDLRDIIEINVGDQGIFGLCWDFASMKCVETNLALTQGKNYDFSEIHVDYLTSRLCSNSSYRDVHKGGNFNIFMNYVKNFNGFVLEEDLEFKEYKETEYRTFYNMDKVDETVYETVDFPSYDKDKGWTNEQFTEYQNALKKHIMNFGSLYVGMESTEGLKNNANLYYYDRADWLSAKVQENNTDGHSMSIVGWDDNYPKENFLSPTGKQPQNDGAYIVLNSYGELYGMDGYIYVSYEDNMIHSSVSGVISTNKKDLINLSRIGNNILVDYLKEQYPDYIINMDNQDYINKINIDEIHSLYLSNRGLTTIKGIEIFENLTVLDISNNNLKDISALKDSSSLLLLDISNNMNIRGWENLTNISTLIACNCGITDISPLKNFTKLYTLDLSENKNIVNLEVVKELDSMYDLRLRSCNITDISSIANSNLNSLDLSENKELRNFEVLNNCNYLYVLKLQDCDINDVSMLNIDTKLSKLTLDLSKNKELNNLECLTNIDCLILRDCNLKDVDAVSKLDTLISLDISNNNIKDITSLKKIIYLNVSENVGINGDLKDGKIQSLTIDNCNLDNDFNFFNLDELFELSVHGNNITLDKIIEKVNCQNISVDRVEYEDIEKLPAETMLNDVTIYKTIKIPDRDVNIDIKELGVNSYNPVIECQNAVLNKKNDLISIKDEKNAQIIIKGIYNPNNKLMSATVVMKLEVDENIKPRSLVVTRLPNKISYRTGEALNFEGLEVSYVYENGVYKKTDNYTVTPLTNLVPGQYMSHGTNTVKVMKDGMECEFHIDYFNTDNSVMLRFKTDEVYKEFFRYIKDRGKKEIISYSDEDKFIEISRNMMNGLRSNPFFPGNWDTNLIDCMLEDKEVFSLFNDKCNRAYFEYTGKKIEIEDIEKIREIFSNLEKIFIRNKTDEDSYKIVSKPEGIEVTIYKNNEKIDLE